MLIRDPALRWVFGRMCRAGLTRRFRLTARAGPPDTPVRCRRGDPGRLAGSGDNLADSASHLAGSEPGGRVPVALSRSSKALSRTHGNRLFQSVGPPLVGERS